MSGRPAAITTESLSKMYKAGGTAVAAVDRLDLVVETGQVYGFLGPNGAGKTTTIKMICGLVAPTSGAVYLNGIAVGRQRRQAMAQIGAVLEGTRNVYWRLTAWQNLLYFGRLKGRRQGLEAWAEQLLRDLGLWERRGDHVGNFSRGMQQKVAIACALIGDPPIILLDEPTLGLDVQAARTIREWIPRLAQEMGKTVVLTTHQLDVAQEVCDRIAIMNRGRLIADEPTGRLLDLFRQEHYQVRVQGDVVEESGRWVVEVTARRQNDETILTCSAVDQMALYQILAELRRLELPLIAVERVEPDLEEIFIQLVERT